MNIILHRLQQKMQTSVARFNDGEYLAMFSNSHHATSRGKQKITPSLRSKLLEALDYRAEGWFIGYPCPVCFDLEHEQIMKRLNKVGVKDSELIPATFATNHNYNIFKSELFRVLEHLDVAILANKTINIPLDYTMYECPEVNAEEKSEEIIKKFKKHDVYILTAGAISRYIAYRIHQLGGSALDLGAIFDPEKGERKRNGKPIDAHVWHSKYMNNTRYCHFCNLAGKI